MTHCILWAAVLVLGIFPAASAAGNGEVEAPERSTVVLVHGAFANADSWSAVVDDLKARGVTALSVQLPLTSLEADAAATRDALRMVTGKVILVGHSWGGTVITEAGLDSKVIALVYIAAFAPSVGQSTAEQGKDFPVPPGSAGKPDSDGLLWLTEATFARDFAQDLDRAKTRKLFSSQLPIRLSAVLEPVTSAAWKGRPSWYVLTEFDRMISPELQEATAARIGARVRRLPTSHVAMLARPAQVADVIVEAMNGKAVEPSSGPGER